jgi:L-2-hydroxyglutarate oxidase LhgO
MEKQLKVLLVEPNKLPTTLVIDNNLKSKQKLVEGDIEYAYADQFPDIVFICNEEGKINGMPYNRDIGADIIAGPFLIVGDDYEKGEDKSLTDSQIKKYQSIFNKKSIEDTNIRLTQIMLKNNGFNL